MHFRSFSTSAENWKDLIGHRKDVLLEGIEIFRDYLVVEERSNGLNKIQIRPWSGEGAYYLPFESETYTAYTTTNPDFDTEILRYAYQSMATPSSVVDFNMKTKEKTVLKEQEILGGKFDKNNYVQFNLGYRQFPKLILFKFLIQKEVYINFNKIDYSQMSRIYVDIMTGEKMSSI